MAFSRSCVLQKSFVRNFSIARVGIVGAGQMGTGIGIVAAKCDKIESVSIFDNAQAQLDKSQKFVESWTKKQLSKQALTEESANSLMSKIQYSLWNSETGDSCVSNSNLDFVVEAVKEDLEIKSKLFKTLDKNTPSSAILASNTSSVSITKLGAVTDRPSKVIGMHFFNPVPVMKLVEVVRGYVTSEETLEETKKFGENLGKSCATVLDRPGFVANRMLVPYINEAVFCYQDGTASVEDIDKVMKLGTNVPMGPLELADFVGLDTILSIMHVLLSEYGDSKYRPAPLLAQMVAAGHLGKKTGKGFYTYN